MGMGKKIKQKKSKKSLLEMILELKTFLKSGKTAEEIRKEIKDILGYRVGEKQIKMALLRLLRKKIIKRNKEGKSYKYSIK